LRTSIIHNLIKYLIDQTELLFYIIFCNLSIAICLTDENKLVKKLDGHCAINICFGRGQKDEVFVRHRDVRNSIQEEDWIISVFLCGYYLRTVMLYLGTSDVVLKRAID
jgi:hypothetical protein